MGKTKKAGTTGRFGARYGRSIKKRVLDVEIRQKGKHACPKCGFMRVKRVNRGIFECGKCGNEFAGGAYLPRTMAGGIIGKMVSQRKFVPAELEVLREGAEEAGKAGSGAEGAAKGGKGGKSGKNSGKKGGKNEKENPDAEATAEAETENPQAPEGEGA